MADLNAPVLSALITAGASFIVSIIGLMAAHGNHGGDTTDGGVSSEVAPALSGKTSVE